MAQRGSFVVRPLTAGPERQAYAEVVLASFATEGDGGEATLLGRGWIADELDGPDVRPQTVRGAFAGDRLVAGYMLWTRRMRVAGVLARVGCVGNVATAPAERGRGAGRAMLLDALAEARRRRLALLFLDGTARFYTPFGFVDVWDPEHHAFALADAWALSPTRTSTRPAVPADAPALVALYRRHFGRYSGSFARNEAFMRHRLDAGGGGEVEIALDAAGRPRGYILVGSRRPEVVREAAADTADALFALVRAHARRTAALASAPDRLRWRVPADGLAFAWLADAVALTSEVARVPAAGWMARPGEAGAAADLAARVARTGRRDAGALRLVVDGATCADDGPGAPEVRLTGAVWLALAFGYRGVAWAAAQPGQRVPAAARRALAARVGGGPTHVPGGDWF